MESAPGPSEPGAWTYNRQRCCHGAAAVAAGTLSLLLLFELGFVGPEPCPLQQVLLAHDVEHGGGHAHLGLLGRLLRVLRAAAQAGGRAGGAAAAVRLDATRRGQRQRVKLG